MAKRIWLLLASAALAVACADEDPLFPAGVELSVGTWGGVGAGMIVDDPGAHVHIGCTFGNLAGRIPLDPSGRFSLSGTYMLRAYPIAIGPELPARFIGRVTGSTLRLTVVVNDTVEKRTVVKGPVTLQFGRDPELGPCPICRVVPSP